MDQTKTNLERIRAYTQDQCGDMITDEWDESKHDRADNGQFSSGGGSGLGRMKAGSRGKTGATVEREAMERNDREINEARSEYAAQAAKMRNNTNRLMARMKREKADPDGKYSDLIEKQMRRDRPDAEGLKDKIDTANARMKNKFDRLNTLKELARATKGRRHG